MRCSCQSNFINGSNCLFEIYLAWDNERYFNYLNHIENIIRPDICSRLQSLVLPATSPELTQLIFRDEFPCLRICHLGQYKPLNLPLTMPIQQRSFSQLSIREQNGYDLKTILFICAGCFPSMKCLRLDCLENFIFHSGQFDFTADQCREHVKIIKFREIVDYLRYRCPLLEIVSICKD
ncbi:unnamed protein product, partial [Rotaria socialis]